MAKIKLVWSVCCQRLLWRRSARDCGYSRQKSGKEWPSVEVEWPIEASHEEEEMQQTIGTSRPLLRMAAVATCFVNRLGWDACSDSEDAGYLSGREQRN